jgi:hypothetical protein
MNKAAENDELWWCCRCETIQGHLATLLSKTVLMKNHEWDFCSYENNSMETKLLYRRPSFARHLCPMRELYLKDSFVESEHSFRTIWSNEATQITHSNLRSPSDPMRITAILSLFVNQSILHFYLLIYYTFGRYVKWFIGILPFHTISLITQGCEVRVSDIIAWVQACNNINDNQVRMIQKFSSLNNQLGISHDLTHSRIFHHRDCLITFTSNCRALFNLNSFCWEIPIRERFLHCLHSQRRMLQFPSSVFPEIVPQFENEMALWWKFHRVQRSSSLAIQTFSVLFETVAFSVIRYISISVTMTVFWHEHQ